MHVIKQALLMMILCFLVQLWLPWWTLVFPCALISYVSSRSGFGAFMAGFLAIGVLWLGLSLYIDGVTSSALSQKIAILFMVKSIWLLRAAMMLVGGLTGGFASLSAYSIKSLR
jgi:hypothetical protein